jgi:hypothetical protein
MEGERSARALARIEAAMRRIEVVAQHPPVSGNSEIEKRYRDLWTSANAALSEIDGLIGAIER